MIFQVLHYKFSICKPFCTSWQGMFIINSIFFLGQGFAYQEKYKEKRGKWLLKICLKLTDTCKTAKGKDTKFFRNYWNKVFQSNCLFCFTNIQSDATKIIEDSIYLNIDKTINMAITFEKWSRQEWSMRTIFNRFVKSTYLINKHFINFVVMFNSADMFEINFNIAYQYFLVYNM